MREIGILHPGDMGVCVAASAINSGHKVYWTSQGRSKKTRARAEEHRLTEVISLSELCQICEIILSVCPPHAAQDLAYSVIENGFKGLYLDANAIAPQHSIKIGQLLDTAGVRFVDGGIIGGPAWKPKETILYLSGNDAEEIAVCFSKGPLETKVISKEVGKASSLKMCYAAYSKGTTALLAAILATAEALGVHENLCDQWDMDTTGFSDQVHQRVKRVTSKAWRFEGEMREIANTFQEAGVPDGFHEAAAEIYHRIASLKISDSAPTIDEIVHAIVSEKK